MRHLAVPSELRAELAGKPPWRDRSSSNGGVTAIAPGTTTVTAAAWATLTSDGVDWLELTFAQP